MKSINLKILAMCLLFILIIVIGKSVFAKYILETSEVLIIETNLDRTAPKLTVSYSTTNMTNGNVTVTIKSNEKVKKLDGWNISEDKMTLTKIFESNTSENVKIYDLAGNSNTIKININNIDKIKPIIECTEIKNSNSKYPLYANSEKEINLTIKISDNIEIKNVDLNKITIKVGNSIANLTKQWTLKSSNTKEKIYNLKLTNIKGDGVLAVNFESGFVTDTATNINAVTTVNTKINIDNTKPNVNYSQSIISQGKVNAVLTANEKIIKLDGWNISSDSKKLNKDFVSNVSYETTVTDLAGNRTTATVNVTGATYISLIYASHNSNIGWRYGYGNYDIAGKESVKTNSKYKTEALAFRVTGNISNDFVRARAYVHTHWGNSGKGRCSDTGMIYNQGYNPSASTWKTMNSSDLVTIEGNKYFQFGGAGINSHQNTDINGNGAIDAVTANEFHYGICGITLALKDYTDYSIVYQIYVSEVGWLEAKSNGQETMYSKTKPMSAFRVAFVPTSEKQNQINTWNKDIGKKIQ